MAWYDNAVFYHIYPLGLCGCAHENDGQPTPGAFTKLNAWASTTRQSWLHGHLYRPAVRERLPRL